jgi:hypothetical protein
VLDANYAISYVAGTVLETTPALAIKAALLVQHVAMEVQFRLLFGRDGDALGARGVRNLQRRDSKKLLEQGER